MALHSLLRRPFLFSSLASTVSARASSGGARRACSALAGLSVRGGGDTEGLPTPTAPLPRGFASSSAEGSASVEGDKKYVTLDDPAPGSPFHYAFPVHSLEEAK